MIKGSNITIGRLVGTPSAESPAEYLAGEVADYDSKTGGFILTYGLYATGKTQVKMFFPLNGPLYRDTDDCWWRLIT